MQDKSLGLCTRLLFLGLMVLCSTGATCIRRRPIQEFTPPVAFDSAPTLEQLCQVVNRSQRIQQLQSNAVTIRAPEVPPLTATMAWQRQRSFRVRAGVSRLTGNDMDLGSNDQVFWMATRHGPAPQLYYAQHEQFDAQLSRQILPVSPLWLVEAMGVIEIDPYSVLGAPQMRADGMLEIQTAQASPAGQYLRTIVIEPKYGYVRQVLLRDPSGRLLANANLSDHEYYESVEYSLPRKIQVQLTPSGGPPINLELEVGYYAINSLEGNDPDRFTMPDFRGYQAIDLARVNGMSLGPLPMDSGTVPAAYVPNPYPNNVAPSNGYPATSYRGFNTPTIMR